MALLVYHTGGVHVNEIQKAGFMAHAQTDGFQRKVDHALDIIRLAPPPYVAFSGGKDSLVALALARQIYKYPTAMWCDDELEYPEQETYIPDVCAHMGVDLVVMQGGSTHADWFRPWTDTPFWRQPSPYMIWDDRHPSWWAMEHGYEATILGLRRDESIKRRLYLSKKHEVYQVKTGMVMCHPIAGWTLNDIWAAIVAWNLTYNPVYDRLTEIGVPLSKQRVGPLPLSNAGHLREGWPEMYSRLVARYGSSCW
jgi:phosphoadenosine phosphosulfate reductase